MTKSDNSRQLNQKQLNAIDLLISGKSDLEVAEIVGVTRQTVNQWRNQDAVFAAELNNRRQDIWGAYIERLRGLIGQAIDVIGEELKSEDPKVRHSAAVHVLKAVGLYGTSLYPEGEISPRDIEQAWQKQANTKFMESLSLKSRLLRNV